MTHTSCLICLVRPEEHSQCNGCKQRICLVCVRKNHIQSASGRNIGWYHNECIPPELADAQRCAYLDCCGK